MSTVEGKKQEKRRALLDAAYELFLERGTAKTSVEDITSRAKVGKGTFYLYFQDKGAVMQALLGRVSYQLLNDACLAVEQHPELPDFTAQVVFVIDHIIEALRQDVLVLRFLERNFVWPGLDQIEASREAEPHGNAGMACVVGRVLHVVFFHQRIPIGVAVVEVVKVLPLGSAEQIFARRALEPRFVEWQQFVGNRHFADAVFGFGSNYIKVLFSSLYGVAIPERALCRFHNHPILLEHSSQDF